MRNAFADEILSLAQQDERLVLLSADIGNRLFDKYKVKFGKRFFNTGVAEANTISMAAGFASCGMRPVCYTITPFITARCYEQIKVDLCYHDMPVLIVGTGSGLSYAALGVTHHSLDDIALMRVLPEMHVFAPADSMELRSCLRLAMTLNKPAYIRIGKKGEPVIFPEPPTLALGQWNSLRSGEDVTLLSAGNMLPVALEVADLLKPKGVLATVYSCASVKPLDSKTLADSFSNNDVVATLEEHSLSGGFGSSVAEWLVDQPNRFRARLLRYGADDHFLHDPGEQEEARETYGLTAQHISEGILKALAGK